MITNGRFEGRIDGKKIDDFVNNLNYDLTQVDRIGLVNERVNTQKSGNLIFPDVFFEDFFEQRDTSNGVNTSHIKICASSKDGLSTENQVCKSLERMADYILYAPDAEALTTKTVYNFYSEDNLGKRMNKEVSLDNIASKLNKTNGAGIDEVIDFLKTKGSNYKKSIVQKISAKDLADESLAIVHEYEEAIKSLQVKASIAFAEGDTGLKRRCQNQIGLMRDDQLMCKDMIKGTMYFKHCLSDSTATDYDQFDFTNAQHLMALIKVHTKVDFDSDLYCLTKDLDNVMVKCEFTELETSVLELWKKLDATQITISEKLEIEQYAVSRTLTQICNKIASVYSEEYEDWYYLHVEKGTYKTCTRCGEIKLTSHFGNDSRNKSGFKSICRECDKLGKVKY